MKNESIEDIIKSFVEHKEIINQLGLMKIVDIFKKHYGISRVLKGIAFTDDDSVSYSTSQHLILISEHSQKKIY